MYPRIKTLSLLVCLFMASISISKANSTPGDHPYYLHALSDLRAARWMIQHRPGNWVQSMDEMNAIKQIDAAINDLKQAAIDDGKNIDDHPQLDERNDHNGRLHEAVDFLKKAHEDVNHEEDNNFARGIRNRSFKHIDEAIKSVKMAIHS